MGLLFPGFEEVNPFSSFPFLGREGMTFVLAIRRFRAASALLVCWFNLYTCYRLPANQKLGLEPGAGLVGKMGEEL